MSWPQIAVILVLGFVLGALWMRARCRHMLDRDAVFIQSAVDKAMEALPA